MGFLDKLFGRAKNAGRESRSTGDSGGGREGARVTEPARTSGEGTRPTEPPDPGRREGAGPESGPR
jgi:hypothetical protein